jgi:hypothetical protein
VLDTKLIFSLHRPTVYPCHAAEAGGKREPRTTGYFIQNVGRISPHSAAKKAGGRKLIPPNIWNSLHSLLPYMQLLNNLLVKPR